MSDYLRSRLAEELAGHEGLPVDTLVAGALHRGRRARRIRRAGAAAGTAAVVALVVLAATIGSQLSTGPASAGSAQQAGSPALSGPVASTAAAGATTPTASTPVPAVASAPVSAAASATAAIPPAVTTGPPAGVPATTGGVLQLLDEQLSTLGTTSHAAVTTDDPLHVQLYLTTATGTGMVRVSVQRSDFTPAICLGLVAHPVASPTCRTDADGDYVVTYDNAYENDCIETHSVQVIHPDGSEVEFDLSTCLAWDGTQNAPSPQIITTAQAAGFGADPRWDLSMSQALVAAGATHFPSPATFS